MSTLEVVLDWVFHKNKKYVNDTLTSFDGESLSPSVGTEWRNINHVSEKHRNVYKDKTSNTVYEYKDAVFNSFFYRLFNVHPTKENLKKKLTKFYHRHGYSKNSLVSFLIVFKLIYINAL